MTLLSNLLMMFAFTLFASTGAIKDLDSKRGSIQIEQMDQKIEQDPKPIPLERVPVPIDDQPNTIPLK